MSYTSPEDGSSGDGQLSNLSRIGYSSSHCGYCNSSTGSYSYYCKTKHLTAQFYEDLLLRGWRRSGTILYKPDQSVSCCPHYTIRLDATTFKPTKDQRQSLNRFNRFLLGEEYMKECTRLHPKTREENTRRKEEFNLAERVHEGEYSQATRPPEPAHKLEVTLESDQFTEEKFTLFENYQRIVHHEPPSRISRQSFKDFLCNSPLERNITSSPSNQEIKLGSYHQCYRLDGKLVAIGVLDFIPSAISAVYFMYHEEIHKWSPGKLSALREASLAAETGRKWYKMGFYIHGCQKMKYKADFHGQHVLDPDSHEWNPLDEDMNKKLDAKLEKGGYVSISRDKREGIHAPDSKTRETEESGKADAKEELDNNDETDDSSSEEEEEEESKYDATPLFNRTMPGVLTKAEIQTADHDGDLSRIKFQLKGGLYEVGDTVMWDSGSIDDIWTLKGRVADMVTALGLDLAKRMFITFE